MCFYIHDKMRCFAVKGYITVQEAAEKWEIAPR